MSFTTILGGFVKDCVYLFDTIKELISHRPDSSDIHSCSFVIVQASVVLPSNFEEVATGVLKVLNNVACLDMTVLQCMLVSYTFTRDHNCHDIYFLRLRKF